MGRHKKNCVCNKCKAKNAEKSVNEIENENVNEIEKENVNEIEKEIKEIKESEKVGDEKIEESETPREEKILEGDKKLEQTKMIISPLVDIVDITIIAKIEPLTDIEKELLTDAFAKVVIKYSDIAEFKYKEEAYLLVVISMIFYPRYKKYQRRLENEKENEKIQESPSLNNQSNKTIA